MPLAVCFRSRDLKEVDGSRGSDAINYLSPFSRTCLQSLLNEAPVALSRTGGPGAQGRDPGGRLLRQELLLNMALMGRSNIASIDRSANWP
jgi:hypothetical protein